MLYNGKEVTKENVLAMLRESPSSNGYMTDKEQAVIRIVASQDYDGAESDLECLTEHLENKEDSNWSTVFDILSEGDWYYMYKYTGKQWRDISTDERKYLLSIATCTDGRTGEEADDGECIVDFIDTLSVSGRIEDYNIIIDDEAILYNPRG